MTTYDRVYALMQDRQPRSCQQVSRELACHHTGVSGAFKRMREQGEAHICGSAKNATGAAYALWVFGPGEDVPMPAAMTKAEKRAKNLKQKRQAARRKARREWTARSKAIKPFRDPLVVALFGEYSGAE